MANLRDFEIYRELRVPPNTFLAVRIDGRGFSSLTQQLDLVKPFDVGFRDAMVAAAEAVLVDCGGLFAFTESDEISVLLPRDSDWFGRRVEKLVSAFAGMASAALTLRLGCCAAFDARLLPLATVDDVEAYFWDRQDDANRNAINSLAYYQLLEKGATVAEATETLRGRDFSFMNETLFRLGINYNEVEAWKKRGVLLRFEEYDKPGFNPLTQRSEAARRRRLVVDLELPLFRRQPQFLRRLLGEEGRKT